MEAFRSAPKLSLETIKVVAADIDGTLTEEGKLTSRSIRLLEELQAHQITVILVTGRSTGWAQGLATYLPGIEAVVAENGGVICYPNGEVRRYSPISTGMLDAGAAAFQAEFGVIPTNDNQFRITDRTFERPTTAAPVEIAEMTARLGPTMDVVASSIHIHVKHRGIDKATGLRAAMQDLDLGALESVLVIGDSPNDSPLFGTTALSVAVSNIRPFAFELGTSQPKYVTELPEVKGFEEVVAKLCIDRSESIGAVDQSRRHRRTRSGR